MVLVRGFTIPRLVATRWPSESARNQKKIYLFKKIKASVLLSLAIAFIRKTKGEVDCILKFKLSCTVKQYRDILDLKVLL